MVKSSRDRIPGWSSSLLIAISLWVDELGMIVWFLRTRFFPAEKLAREVVFPSTLVFEDIETRQDQEPQAEVCLHLNIHEAQVIVGFKGHWFGRINVSCIDGFDGNLAPINERRGLISED